MKKVRRYSLFKISFLIIFFILLSLSFRCLPHEQAPLTRKAAKAGTWYQGSKEELNRSLEKFFNATPAHRIDGHIKALIVPHAGYLWSGKCAAAAYKCLQGKDYRRVFILGFSHHYRIPGVAVSVFDYYETPLGKIEVDRKICENLLKKKGIFMRHRMAEEKEHSIEIQLPFLQKTLKNFKIIPIMVGSLESEEEYKEVAHALREFMDPKTLFIVSSDFTHYGRGYGYLPFQQKIKEKLQALDQGAISRIIDIDFDGFQKYLRETQDTICGRKPIALLLKLLDKNNEGMLLMYYRSADMTGDFSNSVSYAAIVFTEPPLQRVKEARRFPSSSKESWALSSKEKEILLKIARETLISHLTGSEALASLLKKVPISDHMKEKRGVFVTLKKYGHLRGCIGYITGRKSIIEAVIDNTKNASTRDPRFPPMTSAEIDKVKIEISVMTPLKQIRSVEEIKVGRDGLVIEHRGKRGVLLPQVATENGWDREQFLNAICRKAGLPEFTWKKEEPVIKIFEAQVFGEE